MTVYVDDMRSLARVGRVTGRWSHLFADTHDELERFARSLGLAPAWIQHPGTHREHYDLTEAKRAQAVRLGAHEISYLRDVPRLLENRKQQARMRSTPGR
ncbi:DUF4031 domain-containing protein [Nocardioides sp. NPDC057764]|uniref:DUF4031 domain-containing protein n=1 Tax=Nocardioides sp. NPDC057764 TaxID=3346243 RepID=UPI00366D8C88